MGRTSYPQTVSAAGGRTWTPGSVVAILAITALGTVWRLLYVANVSPFVDEYITMWAAMKVLAHGYPLLAFGNIYSHGIAHSYLVAGAFALFGRTETVARLPGLLISLLTLPTVYHIGHRLFDQRVALLTSLLLAMDPQAILWGGRARMYAFQQLCVLLAVYWLYRSDSAPTAGGEARYRLGFVLAFAGAVFNQGITALLLPVMAGLVLLRRGWREVIRWPAILTFALAAGSIGIVWALDRVGLPALTMMSSGQFVPRNRPTFQVALDWSGMAKVLAPYAHMPYAPLTVVFALGLIWGIGRGLRERRSSWRFSAPTAYGYGLILGVMAEVFLLVGHSWKSPRYLFMFLPVFYLIVSAVMISAIANRRVPTSWGRIVMGVLVLAILATYAPAARDATRTRVPGYDRAFAWLRGQRGPDDVVMTVNMPACVFVLGDCGYVAVEKGYEGYAMQDEQGRWVGGWDFIPLLTSLEQLDVVLDAAPTAWFVVDSRRLHDKYTLGFVNRVWERMDLAHEDRGALVFRSQPPSGTIVVEHARPVEWSVPLRLAGFAVGETAGGPTTAEPPAMVRVESGAGLQIILRWQALAGQSLRYTVALQLVALDGKVATRQETRPLHGLYPAQLWRVGEVLVDRHVFELPPNLPAGRYRLELKLLDAATSMAIPQASGEGAIRLAEVEVVAVLTPQ